MIEQFEEYLNSLKKEEYNSCINILNRMVMINDQLQFWKQEEVDKLLYSLNSVSKNSIAKQYNIFTHLVEWYEKKYNINLKHLVKSYITEEYMDYESLIAETVRQDEIDYILNNMTFYYEGIAVNHRDKLFIQLAWEDLSSTEISNIKINDISFENNAVRLQLPKRTKAIKDRNIIETIKKVIEEKNYYSAQPNGINILKFKDSDYLFKPVGTRRDSKSNRIANLSIVFTKTVRPHIEHLPINEELNESKRKIDLSKLTLENIRRSKIILRLSSSSTTLRKEKDKLGKSQQIASIDWALKHIEKYGDTDIFPVPFEFEAIREFWDSDIKPWIRNMDLLDWELRPYKRLLTPKNRYGFRISTQLDPIDSIIYTALVYEIGRDIENYRIDKRENISFSYRFKPGADGRFYDQDYSWDSFQKHSLDLANSGEYNYVLLADIADFYPRIYSHPLEQALDSCTRRVNHVIALKQCFSQLNGSVSYGIPVGQAASRIIAELILDDIDRGLLAEGILSCRYVDDFRIFAHTEREAIQSLGVLANLLFENQGLTLQQNKTKVMTVDNFKKIVLKTDEEKELDGLADRFNEILETIELEMYDELEYDDLDPEIQEEIDRLNLEEILKDHIENTEEIDIPLVRFIVGRLSQINNPDSIEELISNIEKLYPVFKDIMKYFQSISVDQMTKRDVGRRLLDLINDSSLVGHLEYNRMWLLNTFTQDNQWNNETRFATLYNNCHDEYSQRKLILALGRSHQHFWFRSKRRNITQLTPWLKRAFLAASSCLPGDQAEHWYRSIPGLDQLEKVICKWAINNKF